MNEIPTSTAGRRLDGWKSIARYLGRDRTTAMRWASMRGLPVHQLPGGKRASVYALDHELDSWMRGASSGLDRGPPAAVPPRITRRALIGGGIAAVGAGLAGVSLLNPGKAEPPSEVQSMMEQARLLRDQNTRETQNQAIGLYREAARLAPYHADAWGLLGYTYASASHWRDRAESGTLRDGAAMAARKALRLDGGSATGELALAAALPFLGKDNWQARDRGLRRALAASPAHPDVLFALAFILRFTGQQAEAAAMCERIEPRHYTPSILNVWIRALWSAGRLDETDRLLNEAASRFPGNRMLWLTRLDVLMFGGRQDAAARLTREARDRPSTIAPDELGAVAMLIDGLERAPSARADARLPDLLRSARHGSRKAINAVRFASLAGHLDEAFAVSEAYFFARGFSVADDIGGGLVSTPDQRHTNFLFEPPLAAMRADPRFAKLTEDLGLHAYWRDTVMPDYLRSNGTAIA